MRRHLALGLALVLSAAGPLVAGAPATAGASSPTIAQLIGQKLVVAMSGTTPSASLLGRIRRGEVGGVILFGSNITTQPALVALTAQLHAAAAAGGQPHFLVMVDQEGGSIKRIPWAPPTLSPARMGSLGSTTVARDQGAATGVALKALGVDVDLAPVVDVPASTASFLYRQHRTWSFSATRTEWLTNAFVAGMRNAGEVPVMKHFPGLGYATLNTDTSRVTITQSAAKLAPGLLPYRLGISRGVPMIMLSNATYPAWDRHYAAGWSKPIQTLLRTTLGFRGVTITDSLDGTANTRGLSAGYLALLSAKAGTDMLLLTGSESESAGVFDTLVHAAETGGLKLTTLQASWARILALKAKH
ncbi:MAG TPA: glycoside hydrolase family 3 N-terminal domain-containing protein [Candidatus Limnocylindrales bacterium]|nr:glycoside hydrolase family 3 N-terminal domain-containing protein [Candidatus Limnocylindrales bacterium]